MVLVDCTAAARSGGVRAGRRETVRATPAANPRKQPAPRRHWHLRSVLWQARPQLSPTGDETHMHPDQRRSCCRYGGWSDLRSRFWTGKWTGASRQPCQHATLIVATSRPDAATTMLCMEPNRSGRTTPQLLYILYPNMRNAITARCRRLRLPGRSALGADSWGSDRDAMNGASEEGQRARKAAVRGAKRMLPWDIQHESEVFFPLARVAPPW